MQRHGLTPRPNLGERCRELGFAFHTIDGEVYWDESAYYSFTLAEIEKDIEAPAAELAALCLEFVDRACRDDGILDRLCIPDHARDLVADSWRRREASLYGRFDFAYSGDGPAKLLEYNADTPTALYEAAVFQWVWLEDRLKDGGLPRGADQFNSLHDRLIARFAEIAPGAAIHFAALLESAEDRGTVEYLADCAKQAGLAPSLIAISDIGSRGAGPFVDLANKPVDLLFKLYPWEWMLADAFGTSPSMRHTRFLEPPWKAVLSNKGLLPYLWEMAPGHPNLLPAFFEDDPRKFELGPRFAKKPILSREGANVLLVDGDRVVGRTDGGYGAEGHVRQALAGTPAFDGNYPVIGAWIVGDEPAGMGLREDASRITGNRSRFVPHAIV